MHLESSLYSSNLGVKKIKKLVISQSLDIGDKEKDGTRARARNHSWIDLKLPYFFYGNLC